MKKKKEEKGGAVNHTCRYFSEHLIPDMTTNMTELYLKD